MSQLSDYEDTGIPFTCPKCGATIQTMQQGCFTRPEKNRMPFGKKYFKCNVCGKGSSMSKVFEHTNGLEPFFMGAVDGRGWILFKRKR